MHIHFPSNLKMAASLEVQYFPRIPSQSKAPSAQTYDPSELDLNLEPENNLEHVLSNLRQEMQTLQDETPRRDHADATEAFKERIWRTWIKFCHDIDKNRDPEQILLEGKYATFVVFFKWYSLKHSNCRRVSSFEAIWRGIRLVYFWKSGRDMEIVVGRRVGRFIHVELRHQKDLIPGMRAKHVVGSAGLCGALFYHWQFDTERFAHGRDRVQLATILLFLAYTGARPGAIVESGADGIRGTNEALCYKDVKLKLLRPPHGEALLILEITIRLDKGKRKRCAPKTLTVWENPECPALCPVVHFLALAFADNAFHPRLVAEGFGPKDMHTIVPPDGRHSVDFSLRDDILETPIFRTREYTVQGVCVHPTKALSANDLNRWTSRLGKRAGFEFPFNPYCLRREVGTQLTDQGVSDQQRNQVMGHARSETFLKHYISSNVVVDVQAAFLGQESKSQLFKEAGKLCLRLDPRLPKRLTPKQREEVCEQPALVQAQAQVDTLRLRLKGQYGTISKAQGSSIGEAYTLKKRRLSALKRRAFRAAFERELRSFHESADLDLVVREIQGHGRTSYTIPSIQHSPAERAWIADNLFVPANKQQFSRAIETMARFCELGDSSRGTTDATSRLKCDTNWNTSSLHTPIGKKEEVAPGLIRKPCKLRLTIKPRAHHQPSEAREKPPDLLSPFASRRRIGPLTCLFCVVKQGAKHEFKRSDGLRRHYKSVHLKKFKTRFPCPVCEQIIDDPEHFANHAVKNHGSNLGVRAPIMENQHCTRLRYDKRIYL